MSTDVITFDSMRDKLHTLEHVHDVLQRTEPLATHTFTVGQDVHFTVERGWQTGLDARAGTDRVAATIALGRGPSTQEFELTKDALLEATSACGINQTYVSRCPAELIEPQLNYWFREGMLTNRGGNRDFQLLVAGGVGAAVTRASITPFSNLSLVEQALAGVRARFGDVEVLADYKFDHSLRRTHLRLILPGQRRTITGTDTPDDEWSIGLQVKNSLIGAEKTAIDGYLFRWYCTNGAIDTHSTSGTWTRRGGGTEEEVYEWARGAVDEVLGGLEHALDRVQETVHMPIQGRANEVLRDVFDRYRTPVPERARIVERMVEAGQLTMYSVMGAITEVANDDGMDPRHVEGLLRMGGDLPHAAHDRCGECYRLMRH